MSFENKVAFVAGAGGGMGLNIANDLIAEGANVTLIDIKDKPSEIAEGPGESCYFAGDATDENFIESAVRDTVAKFGRIDYLVNCTGVLLFGKDVSLVDIDLDLWDRVLAINLKSFVLTTRHIIPIMQKGGGGAMVHVSSCQACRGDSKAQDAYGASKGAILSLSKSLAMQFAKDHIRSNALLPGGTLSPMQERWSGKEQEIGNSIPLGRLGTTQDQSNACLFLLSEKASYITGIELIVDGGVMADA